MRSGDGATTFTSTVVTATAQDTDSENAPMEKGKLNAKIFRQRARQSTSHKNAEELQCRVSILLKNEICCNDVLQEQVRKHANKMMGRTRGKKVELAPKETVFKYKQTGEEEDGPSKDLFRPDFSDVFPESNSWNIRLAEIFADDYTKNNLPFSQLRDVSKYFLEYLRSLKSAHSMMTTNATSGEETLHEKASRNNRMRNRKITVRLLSHLLYKYTNAFHQINSGSKTS
jgi:hypothetical protein